MPHVCRLGLCVRLPKVQPHTPEPTSLVLIRHAQAADRDAHGVLRLSGQVDLPLTQHGRGQADALRQLAPSLGPVDALYTSTLRRARETARPLAEALGVDVRRWRSLREISCGQLDGLSITEVRTNYPDLWDANLAQADDDFCWPGGETYRSFRRRVMRAVRRIIRTHPGGRVVIVTHAGVISQVLGTLADEPASRWERFRPGTASLTEVSWRGTTGTLVRFDVQLQAMP